MTTWPMWFNIKVEEWPYGEKKRSSLFITFDINFVQQKLQKNNILITVYIRCFHLQINLEFGKTSDRDCSKKIPSTWR